MHLNGKLEISFWKELRTEPSTAQHSRAQYGIAFPESKPPHCYRLRLGSQQLLSLGTAMAPEVREAGSFHRPQEGGGRGGERVLVSLLSFSRTSPPRSMAFQGLARFQVRASTQLDTVA